MGAQVASGSSGSSETDCFLGTSHNFWGFSSKFHQSSGLVDMNVSVSLSSC